MLLMWNMLQAIVVQFWYSWFLWVCVLITRIKVICWICLPKLYFIILHIIYFSNAVRNISCVIDRNYLFLNHLLSCNSNKHCIHSTHLHQSEHFQIKISNGIWTMAGMTLDSVLYGKSMLHYWSEIHCKQLWSNHHIHSLDEFVCWVQGSRLCNSFL